MAAMYRRALTRQTRILVAGNHALPLPSTRCVLLEQRAFLSSSTSGKKEEDSGGWFSNWAEKRTKNMFREHMEDIAKVETYTVGDYQDGLTKQLSSWTASMSGLFGASEVKHAKASLKLMEAIVPLVGRSAGVKELGSLTQLQKLKIATECDMTLERLNTKLEAVKMSSMSHRLLHHLKKIGKPTPEEPDDLKNLLQTYARDILTPREWAELKNMYRSMAQAQSQAPGQMRGMRRK
jgi:hypothetical protein